MKIKFMKLFSSTAAACLLVGASGTAMAVNCLDGSIENTTVEEITVDGRSCIIHNVIVTGDVVAVNSENLSIINGSVGGDLKVGNNRFVTVVDVRVKGRILATNNGRASLALNTAKRIRVTNNNKAVVKRNAALAVIKCDDNIRLDAFENEAGGDVDCRALGGGF